MKALIFGGTGFIGRNLCQELILAGYEVYVVTRNPKKVSKLVSGVKMIEWDGYSADSLLLQRSFHKSSLINLNNGLTPAGACSCGGIDRR